MVLSYVLATAALASTIHGLPLNINLGAYSPALVVGDGEISFGGKQDVGALMNVLEGAAVSAAAGVVAAPAVAAAPVAAAPAAAETINAVPGNNQLEEQVRHPTIHTRMQTLADFTYRLSRSPPVSRASARRLRPVSSSPRRPRSPSATSPALIGL
jgi:uncharacterized membrane protein YedE/YeeE